MKRSTKVILIVVLLALVGYLLTVGHIHYQLSSAKPTQRTVERAGARQ
ncbi:hypothetical protein [Spirosoma montaniterrae]|nr:hypothetical protein [Spirosoma montaniterrae]